MELRQVEHFVAVASELSFTRAAERVRVVQSALSTSVAKLERELGVALFDRSRQQIKLTAAGERFRSTPTTCFEPAAKPLTRSASSAERFRAQLNSGRSSRSVRSTSHGQSEIFTVPTHSSAYGSD